MCRLLINKYIIIIIIIYSNIPTFAIWKSLMLHCYKVTMWRFKKKLAKMVRSWGQVFEWIRWIHFKNLSPCPPPYFRCLESVIFEPWSFLFVDSGQGGAVCNFPMTDDKWQLLKIGERFRLVEIMPTITAPLSKMSWQVSSWYLRRQGSCWRWCAG